MKQTLRETFGALYVFLIRGKFLQERAFGRPSLWERLLHLSPLYGVIFSAPAWLFLLWYTGLSVSTHLRHRDASHASERLTEELFQLHLYDRLSADYRRLRMPPPLGSSELPTYGLVLSNDKLSRLESRLPPDEGKINYVDALMQHKNKLYEVEVRYRGTKPWHWNYPQKSWKVRVKGRHVMFDGLPTFNFLNTPDPMPFNEQMVLDVARAAGLLTPSYYPFRLLLNNAYLGVHFFEGQPDEGLLRHERRMPGSIYSGAGAATNPTTHVSSLWESAANWKKVGATGEPAKADFRELQTLIEAVNQGTFQAFADFSEANIDVEKFATLDAIDVLFGNNQHDYNQNHKLYFDPYKNRFEPIATDFRDMAHEAMFNRTEYPLLLRLKALPSYLTLRNRKVYEMLSGDYSEAKLEGLVNHWMARLRPDQERDAYWDAYELLPVMGTYFRQLVRPMNEHRQQVAAAMRISSLRDRLAFLRREIELQQVVAHLYQIPHEVLADAQSKGHETKAEKSEFWAALDVTVQGQAGFQIEEVIPESDASCSMREWQLFADRDLNGTYSEGSDLRLIAAETPLRDGKPEITLYPGVVLNEIPVSNVHGRVRAEPSPNTYRFFVRAIGCTPNRLRLMGRNLATQQKTTWVVAATPGVPPQLNISCEERKGFSAPGERSLHPNCYRWVPDETVHLGPGLVEVNETRVYSKSQTVVIAPGTTIKFGENASLISYGKLFAEGQPDAKIQFGPSGHHWGGVALQGPKTSGSRLSYVEFTQGTRPLYGINDFPGMVNIHDTRDIAVDHASFSKNTVSDDALHVAYVEDFFLLDSRFVATHSDAVDLEYSSGKIERVTAVDLGDDGLDLMGTRVAVKDSAFVRAKGNAVSIGEHSEVALQNVFGAASARGVLLKNASLLRARGVLLHRNSTSIRLEPETEWYPGTSQFDSIDVHAVSAGRQLDGLKSPNTGTVKDTLQADDLPELRRFLLGDEGDWSQLDAELSALSQRGSP